MSETGATPAVSVPVTKAQAQQQQLPQAKRTDPKTFLVKGVTMLGQLALPMAFAGYSIAGEGALADVIGYFLPIVFAVIAFNFGMTYLQWARLTYTVGQQDIRVESGVLSRSARSVPFERIQDVSLEQKLLPRMFGLVAVKFETGAGGGEDLTLTYLAEEEGERLRRVVRERREGQAKAAEGEAGEVEASAEADDGEALFTMGTGRLFTFGLFEFSLAVFAVLGGLLQYADSFIDIDFWDADLWRGLLQEQGETISALGPIAQLISAIAGIIVLLIIGSATGMVRVFLREWEFLLEKTARGFRRRRGLLTKTDVVMPVHRVQAISIGTRVIRYRFGWHGLSFISLAQDAGSASHVVAPFAKMGEIAPIVEAAGFYLPPEDTQWHKASENYRTDSMVLDSSFFVIAAIVAGGILAFTAPEWVLPVVTILIGLAVFSAGAALYSWTFKRHALDSTQIMARDGLLSPQSQIATRLKLHSVELSQGPIARLRGYATVHLGLAGGAFAIPGVPLERAQQLRRDIMETIAATDFSQLEQR